MTTEEKKLYGFGVNDTSLFGETFETVGELITIDTAVRVFCGTWPQRRALSGKFERALRKAVGERMEANVPKSRARPNSVSTMQRLNNFKLNFES